VALVAVPDARVTDLAAPISQAEIAVIAVPGSTSRSGRDWVGASASRASFGAIASDLTSS
jgi:hypothetical protein